MHITNTLFCRVSNTTTRYTDLRYSEKNHENTKHINNITLSMGVERYRCFDGLRGLRGSSSEAKRGGKNRIIFERRHQGRKNDAVRLCHSEMCALQTRDKGK